MTSKTDYSVFAAKYSITKNAAVSRYCLLKSYMQEAATSVGDSTTSQGDGPLPKGPNPKKARKRSCAS
ncbi:hypothetical protein N7486_004692 [Penicillium sp. IBT 16267x]|nr:hypothetical protein N7486_004692 [Penicillium sp. IBT 16267x]